MIQIRELRYRRFCPEAPGGSRWRLDLRSAGGSGVEGYRAERLAQKGGSDPPRRRALPPSCSVQGAGGGGVPGKALRNLLEGEPPLPGAPALPHSSGPKAEGAEEKTEILLPWALEEVCISAKTTRAPDTDHRREPAHLTCDPPQPCRRGPGHALAGGGRPQARRAPVSGPTSDPVRVVVFLSLALIFVPVQCPLSVDSLRPGSPARQLLKLTSISLRCQPSHLCRPPPLPQSDMRKLRSQRELSHFNPCCVSGSVA